MSLELNGKMEGELRNVLKTNDPQQARRALAVLAIAYGADVDTVAGIFNKSTSWAKNLLEGFQSKGVGSIEVKTSPGRPRKYTEDERKLVCDIRRAHPDWALRQVQDAANSKLNSNMSLPTVRAIVLDGGFSFSTKRTWSRLD